jgi:branched-chain amino acid transport system permease protein
MFLPRGLTGAGMSVRRMMGRPAKPNRTSERKEEARV